MRNVPVSANVANGEGQAASSQASIDLAMSEMLSSVSEEDDLKYADLVTGKPSSDSAFDLAISDLFDATKRRGAAR
jgi:hypothetical protein